MKDYSTRTPLFFSFSTIRISNDLAFFLSFQPSFINLLNPFFSSLPLISHPLFHSTIYIYIHICVFLRLHSCILSSFTLFGFRFHSPLSIRKCLSPFFLMMEFLCSVFPLSFPSSSLLGFVSFEKKKKNAQLEFYGKSFDLFPS